MDEKLEAIIREKIYTLLTDLDFSPCQVAFEKPHYGPPELQGRIHICCIPNTARHKQLWIDVTIFSTSSRVSIWDPETGGTTSGRFQGDDTIEAMLVYIKETLPGFSPS